MSSFLTIFTLVSISVQVTISIVCSWLILGCKLEPKPGELQELTLMKLLYLYDPVACDRVYIYNHSKLVRFGSAFNSIEWPVRNDIAASFREKTKLWLALHILWMLFCIGYLTQSHKSCTFYASLLPFTITGVAILMLDVVYASLFIADADKTKNEDAIITYVDSDTDNVRNITKSTFKPFQAFARKLQNEDTTWIALFFAYTSCRGIVLWIINFWVVKDNYFTGLETFRRLRILQAANNKLKERGSLDYAEV